MWKNQCTAINIAEAINIEFGLSKKDCLDIVNDIIDSIILDLDKFQIFKIHNFGTFKLRKKKQRVGRNPKTKKEVMIGERNVITFKPSKTVLSYINNKVMNVWKTIQKYQRSIKTFKYKRTCY